MGGRIQLPNVLDQKIVCLNICTWLHLHVLEVLQPCQKKLAAANFLAKEIGTYFMGQ